MNKKCPICGTLMKRCPDRYYIGPDGAEVREDEIEWECPKCEEANESNNNHAGRQRISCSAS